MGAEMTPEAKVPGGSGNYILNPEPAPVATVTGLYRGTWSGLEPLTKDTPLTLDEVRRNPIFYELELHP